MDLPEYRAEGDLVHVNFLNQKTMKLLRHQVTGINSALRATKSALNEKARYAVAKNLVILGRIARATEKFRVDTIVSLSPDPQAPGLKPDTPEYAAFMDAFKAFASEELEVAGLIPVALEHLNLEGIDNVAELCEALDPILVLDAPVVTP
jgi:hypothetical protein